MPNEAEKDEEVQDEMGTVHVPKPCLKELRVYCVQEDLYMSDSAAEAIWDWLKREKLKRASKK